MDLATVIHQTTGLTSVPGEGWNLDQRRHGPFAPLLYAGETPSGYHLVSSPLTQTEWWQHFMPANLCPRFGGKLDINDWVQPYCIAERCVDACGAEDGFVELRANRFRLDQEAAIIAKRFPYLDEFLRRAQMITQSANEALTMGWQLARHYALPSLEVVVPVPYLAAHLEGLLDLFPQVTGVDQAMTVESMAPLDLEALDLDSEAGLMQMAKHYAEQEILRAQAEWFLQDLIAEKGGSQDAQTYTLPNGLRYTIGTYLEANQGDDFYMGRLEFTGGMQEVRRFVATTLGGGRW